MMGVLALLTNAALAAEPSPVRAVAGLAWSPTDTGALALQASGSFSGTLAGELDGILVPPLRPYAGVKRGPWTALGGLSVVSVDSTRVTETTSRRAVGALRLELEGRRTLGRASEAQPVGFFVGGAVHGNVPLVTLTDEAWTEQEATDAEDTVADLRRRVGGGGASLLGGATVPLLRDGEGRAALSLGMRAGLRAHARAGATTEDGSAVVVVLPEAAVLLEWGR